MKLISCSDLVVNDTGVLFLQNETKIKRCRPSDYKVIHDCLTQHDLCVVLLPPPPPLLSNPLSPC